jgi:hypothetical protein
VSDSGYVDYSSFGSRKTIVSEMTIFGIKDSRNCGIHYINLCAIAPCSCCFTLSLFIVLRRCVEITSIRLLYFNQRRTVCASNNLVVISAVIEMSENTALLELTLLSM